MNAFLESMLARAKADRQTIVLPEGDDERTLDAAEKILADDVADLVILGDADAIRASGRALDGARVVDPRTSDLREELAGTLYELRQRKGMTPEQALALMDDVLYFGVMMVKTGRADGMVAGACHATGDVLRPSLQILKTAPGVALVSSFFVMVVPDCDLGQDGTFLFSDCGLEVQPDAERLAHIAVNSAKSWKALIGTEPSVALLSHSTYGSAKNDDAAKVVEAAEIARELAPDFAIDGELQLGGRVEGPEIPRGRTGERAGVPGPGCRQHRLQAGAAPGQGRGVRPHHPGHRRPGERPFPRLLRRRHRGRDRHHLRPGTGEEGGIGLPFACRSGGAGETHPLPPGCRAVPPVGSAGGTRYATTTSSANTSPSTRIFSWTIS